MQFRTRLIGASFTYHYGSFHSRQILLLDSSLDHYVVEGKKYGNTKECTTGSNINEKDACKEACKELGFPIEKEKDVKGGSPCLKSKSGVCRQDGANRREASLICKVSGGHKFFYLIKLPNLISFRELENNEMHSFHLRLR